MKIVYRVRGVEALSGVLERLRDIRGRGVRDLVNRFALRIQALARIKAPVDTGTLRAGIQMVQGSRGIARAVETTSGYGGWVERGSGPHRTADGSEMFRRSIKAWARRKGLSGREYVIAQAIRRRGVKARPFLRPAVEEATPGFLAAVEAFMRRILASRGRR